MQIKRDPHRIIYASSYDRGLIYLLKHWSKIKKEIPDANLHIFYGWTIFDSIHRNNPAQLKWKEEMQKLMKQKDITEHGRIGHNELEIEFMKSGIWAYPCNFEEIYCHPKGEFIQTINGDKEIEKLTLTDSVISGNGKIRDVVAIRKRKHIGEILSITPQCGSTFKITPEHPVLAISLNKVDQSNNYKNNIKKKAKFIEGKNLKKGDLILLRKLKRETGKIYLNLFETKIETNKANICNKNSMWKKNNLPNKLEIDENLAWFLGYFAGDGSANIRGSKVSCLVANKHKYRDYGKVKKGLLYFGLNIKEKQLNGCIELSVYSKQLARFFRKYFYINKLKTIPRKIYTHFPDSIFDGLMAADGHYCQKDKNGIQGSFTNKSNYLISIIREILSYRNLTGRANKRNHDNGSISYSLTWTQYTKQSQKFYYNDNDYIYLKIRKIDKEQFNDYVYNIDVEVDHTYLTRGIVVHNCSTAARAQRAGAVPITINNYALEETVKNGVKVDVDITEEEGQKEYIKTLIEKLKDEKWQKDIRKTMMPWAKDYFKWSSVAQLWNQLFKENL